ncbi:hypothetical protein J6590_060439 [Homalodisca vitripennis]|nr:hypothetical protein J6590_060439 [Homalodisca vitripennis]
MMTRLHYVQCVHSEPSNCPYNLLTAWPGWLSLPALRRALYRSQRRSLPLTNVHGFYGECYLINTIAVITDRMESL